MFETNYSDFTIQMEPKRNHAKHNWFQVLKFVVPRYYEWVENWWTLLVVRPPFAIKSFSNAVRSKTACPRCDINNPKLQWYLPRIHDKSWQQESPKSSEQNPWRISGDFSLSGCACGGILADWKKNDAQTFHNLQFVDRYGERCANQRPGWQTDTVMYWHQVTAHKRQLVVDWDWRTSSSSWQPYKP